MSRMWQILAALVLALGFAGHPREHVTAYELHGWRWDHLTVTFSADGDMKLFADLAVAYWNAAAGIQFVAGGQEILILSKEPSQPARAETHPSVRCRDAACQAPHTIYACEIRGGALFFAEPDEQKVKLLVHELGHCLGLDHTTTPSIMSFQPVGGLTWSGDDIEGARYLYGLPNRVGWHHALVPMLAR